MKIHLTLAAMLILAAMPALADEKPVALKDGPARELVEGNCGACHSLDYIRTNAPFQTPEVWKAEVNKMINVFGAPIAPADAEKIMQYLSQEYGNKG